MTDLMTRSAVATVALMRIKGIGRRAALRIVGRPIETDDDESELFDRASRNEVDAAELSEAWKFASEQLDRSASAGIASVGYYDSAFPLRLRNIPDPPAVLFIKGEATGLQAASALAIVGTREPTEYGERVAERLAISVVGKGFVIVSGLAHGCDTIAHEGCVKAGGIGIAVMAHGLDKVYPAANKGLAQQLLDGGGCLVSEYPIGMTPLRTSFAERDRIQSGLSDGVLVIETDVQGGTMHTVRFSRQQNRALACIDHPDVWRAAPKAQGNRKLIADGWAVPIENGDALMKFLETLTSPSLPEEDHVKGSEKDQLAWGF